MMTNTIARLLATTTIALAPPAWAHEAAPGTPEDTDAARAAEIARATRADTVTDPAAEGAITVTARRRAESLQNVPIAITALDAKAIELTGSYNVNRLTQLLPSVQFFSSNPRNSNINIRGLGAPFGLTNDGIEQGVGLYIDGVYYSRPAAASFDFVDVERIEVLRGPQGTLYGKNTTAGAVNITTRAPTFELDGRFEASGGNLEFLQLKGSLAGPIVADRLAARLAVIATNREGTLFNRTTGRRVNEQDNLGVRGALLWTPSGAAKVTFLADYNHQNPECCAQVAVKVLPTPFRATRNFNVLAARVGYTLPSLDPYRRVTDADGLLQARQNFGGASLSAERKLGAGTLTSVTAWRFWDWYPANDRDFIGLPITTVSANASKQRQLTQEFRYASRGGGRLDFTAGVFGYRQVIDTLSRQEQGAAASTFLLAPGPLAVPALLDGYGQVATVKFYNNSVAGFGQLSWRVTERLRIEPGLRINYDDKNAGYDANVFGGRIAPGTAAQVAAQVALQRGVLTPQSYRARFSDTNVSGDLKLSFQATRRVLAYFSYARSFKTGGINLGGVPTDAANNPLLGAATVKPESVDHYELGLKTELFDRRATLNVAAFQTDVEDYQTTVINGQLGVLRGYLANARGVRVRGIEAESSVRFSDRLSAYANATLLDAVYTSFRDAPCAVELTGAPSQGGLPLGVCDASGGPIAGASRWAVSYGGEYRAPLSGRLNGFIGLDGSYRSSFSSNPTPSDNLRVPGFALVNFRIGVATNRGFDVFGFVRNAFQERYLEFLSVQPGNTGLIVGQPGDPRTYGVTLRKLF